MVNHTDGVTVFVDDVLCLPSDKAGTVLNPGSVVEIAGIRLVLEARG